jgi:hypothetical protein
MSTRHGVRITIASIQTYSLLSTLTALSDRVKCSISAGKTQYCGEGYIGKLLMLFGSAFLIR